VLTQIVIGGGPVDKASNWAGIIDPNDFPMHGPAHTQTPQNPNETHTVLL
jgi:hypothetical protein